jgi:hypothetical protein
MAARKSSKARGRAASKKKPPPTAAHDCCAGPTAAEKRGGGGAGGGGAGGGGAGGGGGWEGPDTPHPFYENSELEGHGRVVTAKLEAPATGPEHRYTKGVLELQGLDHRGASYEGRVFLNNSKATAKTPQTPSQGYAGKFHVFGHGQCFGDVGHCDVPPKYREEDLRRAHHLEPIDVKMDVTAALRQATKKSGTALTVTLVPVVVNATRDCDIEDVIRFQGLRLATYNL